MLTVWVVSQVYCRTQPGVRHETLRDANLSEWAKPSLLVDRDGARAHQKGQD